MEHNGENAMNPGVRLAALISKRGKLKDELRYIEKQVKKLDVVLVDVYELETSYLQDSNQFGHVLKGFEGFINSSKSTINLKRPRKFQPEDRIFSLSSITSPAVEELSGGRDDFGPGRSKGGSVPANGQAKQKKGRFAA